MESGRSTLQQLEIANGENLIIEISKKDWAAYSPLSVRKGEGIYENKIKIFTNCFFVNIQHLSRRYASCDGKGGK